MNFTRVKITSALHRVYWDSVETNPAEIIASELVPITARKTNLPFKTLYNNATKVLKRPHKRDRSITVNNIAPLAGMNSLTIKADSTGEDGKKYKLTLIFYDVEYSDTPRKGYVPIKINKKITKYYKKPSVTKTPVRSFCECKWYQYVCEWYNNDKQALEPKRKPRPYYPKGKAPKRPVRNPNKLPCICKHLFQLYLELKKRGIVTGTLV